MQKVDMKSAPGHLIRRAQQANSAVWAREVSEDVTSLQFAVLNTLRLNADVDQTLLGRIVAMDRSTTADLVKRMARRRLIRQVKDPKDSRRNVLQLTREGSQTLDKIMPDVIRAGKRLVAPLDAAERKELARILTKLVNGLDLGARKADEAAPARRPRAVRAGPARDNSAPRRDAAE